jgi:hypothetical protein
MSDQFYKWNFDKIDAELKIYIDFIKLLLKIEK